MRSSSTSQPALSTDRLSAIDAAICASCSSLLGSCVGGHRACRDPLDNCFPCRSGELQEDVAARVDESLRSALKKRTVKFRWQRVVIQRYRKNRHHQGFEITDGWVAERFKAPVLKTGRGQPPSWVRIPPHPPYLRPSSLAVAIVLRWLSPSRVSRETSRHYSLNLLLTIKNSSIIERCSFLI